MSYLRGFYAIAIQVYRGDVPRYGNTLIVNGMIHKNQPLTYGLSIKLLQVSFITLSSKCQFMLAFTPWYLSIF